MAVCRKHSRCRKVRGNGSVLEIVKCPWCGWEVSTSNIGNGALNAIVNSK